MAMQLIKGTSPTPLSTLVDDYLSSGRARGLAPKSDKQYTYALHSVFLTWCESEGIERLADLDRRALDRFTASLLNHRKADGDLLSRHSVHTYLRPVRLMLTWAAREGEYIQGKPQLPRRSKPIRDVLSREEIDMLERAVISERDKLIIRIFGDCGPRLEELSRLTPSDVVRSGRQAHIRVMGKRSQVRDIPIPPDLLRRLTRFIENRPENRTSDHIFLTLRRERHGSYEALTQGGIYQVIKDAAARTRLEKRVYPHLLRHSWMTEMLRRGMNPVQLSVIAGASMEVIAQCYAHLNKEDAYDAMMSALAVRKG
jgi:site-specific recombinase XerD